MEMVTFESGLFGNAGNSRAASRCVQVSVVKRAQLREFYSLVIACGPFLKIRPSGVDVIPRAISALPITAIRALLKQHLHRVRSFVGLKHRQHENVARNKETVRAKFHTCFLGHHMSLDKNL